MKKWLVVLVLMLFAVPSYAAWTVSLATTADTDLFQSASPFSADFGTQNKWYVFKVNVVSDASTSSTYTLNTLIDATTLPKSVKQQWKDRLRGSMLYCVKTLVVGTVTSSTLTVTDEVGASLASGATGTSGGAVLSGSGVLGTKVPVTDIKFSATTLGNTEVAAFYFWVLK